MASIAMTIATKTGGGYSLESNYAGAINKSEMTKLYRSYLERDELSELTKRQTLKLCTY